MSRKIVLALSLSLSFLTTIVSCVGLFTENFYSSETPNWQAQSIGQDLIDLLFITPCLLVTTLMTCRNSKYGGLWAGAMLYFTYTFVLYCFDVHFNKLFPVYCICLGLSFYSLAYFFYKTFLPANMNFEKNKAIQTTGIYFILIAVFFYFVWLSEIIPSIRIGETPKSLIETGLPTNGVHVLDLAIVLPGIFLAGILSLRGKRAGLILIPVFLTFFVLMDITIGALVLVMNKKGLESNLSLTAVMGTLAAFSVVLLIWNFKRARYRQGCK